MTNQSGPTPMRRILPPLSVVICLFVSLTANSGFTLQRYGSLSNEDLLLLHQRMSQVIESKDFAACEEWLLRPLIPLFMEQKDQTRFKTVLKNTGDAVAQAQSRKVVVEGNNRWAKTKLWVKPHVADTVQLSWVYRDGDWRIWNASFLRLQPSTYLADTESFLAENRVALSLLKELRLVDALENASSPGTSKDALVLTDHASLKDAAETTPWLVYCRREEAEDRELSLAPKCRLWCFRIHKIYDFGAFIKVEYALAHFPDGVGGKTSGIASTAYMERLREGTWVVTSLFNYTMQLGPDY